jgi:putative membrane protein
MGEYLLLVLDKLTMTGFLETRASLYIDISILFLAILPILSGVSIVFAIRKHIKIHQASQFLLFYITLVALAFFAYTVYYNKGFEILLQGSSIDSSIALALLIAHIIISLSTLTLWMFALIYALSDKKRRGLPGVYSVSHGEAGKRVFKGILLMTLSSMSIYWMLFMA